jgi:CBS domain-containing protein
MRINDVIRRKGSTVVTIAPSQTVRQLLDLLAEHRIGAVVVSTDGRTIEGIVSERDIVRHLQTRGAEVLSAQVREIMTSEVTTCQLNDDIEQLMNVMTDQRVRHIPVVVDGELRAIVSIGDVVKHRIVELQSERDELVGYLNS